MRRTLLVCAALAGCSSDGDKTADCDLSTATGASTIEDRKVIGGVVPYDADQTLAGREEELRASIAARRAAAWQTVAKVLSPVPLADKSAYSLPAWHTWFAKDDFERVFKKLYRDLGPAGRAARTTFDGGVIDAGFEWNTTALDAVPEWTAQRYQDYLAAIDTQEKAQGIGGVNRVDYSVGALRQLLGSYAQQYACRIGTAPDPYVEQPVRKGEPVADRQSVAVSKCEWHVLGPYVASAAAQVTVTTTGDGDADIYVRRGAAPEVDTFDCKSTGGSSKEMCSVDGGGLVYVAVFGAAASTVDVEVDYLAEDVFAPTCLAQEMPRDAVVVKADWRRQLAGENLPFFDTSAARMRERFASNDSWADGDGSANPDPSKIYSMTLPNGNNFRLPALHMMTKELNHWQWITLWWSPEPDTDFGADRPAIVSELPGPWKNYKMCTSVGYIEEDADPRGGFDGTLGDSLEAVTGGAGTPSWCSNPYLELGDGNASTNCIGCHQHGGTDLTPLQILAQPTHGTTRVRNNFFTDYLWAIKGGQGEDLSAIVQAEVDYWDANDP